MVDLSNWSHAPRQSSAASFALYSDRDRQADPRAIAQPQPTPRATGYALQLARSMGIQVLPGGRAA
jgi:hypothetical protein